MPSKNFLLYVLGQTFILIAWVLAGIIAHAYMADADFVWIFVVGEVIGSLMLGISISIGRLLFPTKTTIEERISGDRHSID